MATSGFHFCLLVFCLINLTLFPNISVAKICLPSNHTALFVIGDSILDNGNNNYINTSTDLQSNMYPYGETFLRYPTGRVTDGRNIPDFLAEYAKLPLAIPHLHPAFQDYVNGANFASGGAGVLAETRKGLVVDLNTQLDYFKKVDKSFEERLGRAEAKDLLSKAVILISIGSNDYIIYVTDNSSVFSSYSHDQYVDIVIGNLTNVIEEIYNTGGRKFAFLNVGPLACSPSGRLLANASGSCLEEVSVLAKLHNTALSVLLQKLEKQLEGFKYSLIDFYQLISELIDNPSKYGFKEAKVACCGSGPYRGIFSCGRGLEAKDYELCENPNEYVFFDPGHSTERAIEFCAQQIWDGNGNITVPQNLKSLWGGNGNITVPQTEIYV